MVENHIYYGKSADHWIEVTSPASIALILGEVTENNESIIMFTNEKNHSLYHELKKRFNLYYETDILSLLPTDVRAKISDAYSIFILDEGLAAENRIHICTAVPKMNRLCDYRIGTFAKTYNKLWPVLDRS